MGDDGTGLNGVILNQFRDRRLKARLGILECATAFTFIEGDAPAVFMRPVLPPRCTSPVKLKQISVGTLALIPSSSHIDHLTLTNHDGAGRGHRQQYTLTCLLAFRHLFSISIIRMWITLIWISWMRSA